jgi:hypothetical protein
MTMHGIATFEVRDDRLLIEVDLEASGQPSASGKTLVLASTHGGYRIETVNGPTFVNLNVFRYLPPKEDRNGA